MPTDISHLDSMGEGEAGSHVYLASSTRNSNFRPAYLGSSGHPLPHTNTSASRSRSRTAHGCTAAPGRKKAAATSKTHAADLRQIPGATSGRKRPGRDDDNNDTGADKDDTGAAATASEPLSPSKRPNTQGAQGAQGAQGPSGAEFALAGSKVGTLFSDAFVDTTSTHSAPIST